MEVSDLLAFTIKDLVHTEVKMNGDYVGQNLYMCYGISDTIGSDCVNMWYGEVEEYDFNKMRLFAERSEKNIENKTKQKLKEICDKIVPIKAHAEEIFRS